MATARKSTKGRVCATCHKPKKALDFPTTSAENCLQCLADAASAQPPVVDASVPPDEAPFVVTDSEIDYESPSAQELAARTLARRKLIHFIQRFRPKYLPGWVHEDICRRLERFMKDVEDGKEPRLLLMMPVRHGKSEISSRHFAPFVLGHHPEWEIIAASGASSLALSFSRYIRDLVRSDSYQALFPEMKLDPSSQSVENWNSTKGGGYLAAGIGTMITGRGCFIGSTLVQSDIGDIEIRTLVQLYRDGCAPKVRAYEHRTGKAVLRSVLAAYEEHPNEDLIHVTTSGGKHITCTAEHPVFVVGRGYVAASLLGAGDSLIIGEDMPCMRRGESDVGCESLPHLLRCGAQGREVRAGAVLELRERVRQTALRVAQGTAAWACRHLLLRNLFAGAPRSEERQEMLDLSAVGENRREQQGGKVLFSGMPQSRSSAEEIQTLSPLRHGLRVFIRAAHVLWACLQECRARRAYVGAAEFALQGWAKLQPVVQVDETADRRTRQRNVCSMRVGQGIVHAPSERAAAGQPNGESGNPVFELPRCASQVERDTVSVVSRVRCSGEPVYDLHVEGENNYFAEKILVHNCHILVIDDPVKDAEAADSSVIRDATWEWYMSTALSRLAPGGGVLGILTWWNEDDWAGRVQQLSTMEDADKFEIVKYPAINDQGDEYILADDSIEQLPPGSTIPAGARMTRPQNTALHPARYTLTSLLKRKATYFGLGQQRWWHALYQQSPTVDDGVFFTSKMFRHYVTDPHPLERSTYQTWDFAITEGQQNDYTVGATGHVDERNNLHIADIVRFKSDDSFVIADAILDNWVEHGSCALIGFEDGVIWKSISAVFLRRCEERGLFPSYELLVPLSDKAARAQPLRGLMQGGKVWFKDKASWWEACRKELTQFLSGGKHDDIVDSLAWLARLALKHSAPRAPEPKKIKSWKDGLLARLNGGATTHMSA